MQAERVVELTFEASAGSGYLITPCHVLTARHVVEPLAVGTACTVQPLVAALSTLPRPEPMKGRAAWFAATEAERDLDLAIIELDPPTPAELPPEPVILGSIPANDIKPRPFLCAGFPAAAGTANKTVSGKLAYVPKPMRLDLEVDGALPRDWKQWAGLSGAVVFCGGHAVGVVRTVDGNWDGKLTATPTRRLLETDSFLEYWRSQPVPSLRLEDATGLEPTLFERISANVYLMDRKDPVGWIKQRLRGLQDEVPSQVIIIPGVEDDEHNHVIKQLSEDSEVQRMLGREAKSEQVIVPLPWPLEERQIDPDERFRVQMERLLAAAGVPLSSVGTLPDAARVREKFDEGVTPRAFFTLVSRRIAFGGHGRLLRRLLDFWESLGTGLPVLLFLGFAADDPEPPRQSRLSFLRARPPEPEAELLSELEEAFTRLNSSAERVVSVAELEAITTAHISPWVDELGYRCPALRPGQLELLRHLLFHRVGQGKRARQVAGDVADLLSSM